VGQTALLHPAERIRIRRNIAFFIFPKLNQFHYFYNKADKQKQYFNIRRLTEQENFPRIFMITGPEK
jgi:hypothetical protein